MNKEKFVIFTTDGNFFEFVPEAEADTAREAIDKYLKLTRENKFGNYHILCPDGQVRKPDEIIDKYKYV